MSVPTRPTEAAALDGWPAFHAALRSWMEEAIATRARELWWADPDFEAWPLGERAWIDGLDRWVAAGRSLILLAADDHRLARRHPRWAVWRRTWSHAVELRVVDSDLAQAVPTMALLPGQGAVELIGRTHRRAVLVREPVALQRCRETLHSLRDRSVPGQPVTTLGL